jgi:hypothetical protein
MNPEDLLLRDIHLPSPVSWWPPAIGWWLLLGAICATTVVIVLWWRRRQTRRHAPTTIARHELVRLRSAWLQHGDAQRLVSDLSTWLRRVSMSLSSRQHAAGLIGSKWLNFLDEAAGQPIFRGSHDRLVAELPYRDLANPDGEKMLVLCERWLAAISDVQKARRK